MVNIPKGTKDLLPSESYKWQYVVNTFRNIANCYNFKEIKTPTFEHTELFLRGVGDTTDIVNKEMYTFLDKGDRSITLKPEGTAGVVRSFIENSLYADTMPLKTFYETSVFRYEKPQAGRLREHHQLGIEFFGSPYATAEAEIITLLKLFFERLGIGNLELQINSIGCASCRKAFNDALKDYYRPNLDKMCSTCRERFDKNPLRMLDCKEEACIEINKNAPSILDYLCDDCKVHFESLKKILDSANIEYKVNPRIVRGLDYYSRTVFEFVSKNIGSQGTVCGGGRYDSLVEILGGKPNYAVGFGCGIERVLLLMENCGIEIPKPQGTDVYFATFGDKAQTLAFNLCAKMRRDGLVCELEHLQRSFKAQFKYANKLNAKYVIVIGDDEINNNVVKLKDMSNSAEREIGSDLLFGQKVDLTLLSECVK